MKKPEIYQLKITLKYSKPPIWRRVLVENTITLAELHDTIQLAFDWTNSHLHQFNINGTHYSLPDPGAGWGSPVENGADYQLCQVVSAEGSKFVYEYDFGDSWYHDIVLEKILPVEPDKNYPRCIAGKNACPPEDIGGIPGYYMFLEIINDPDHPEREGYLEWLGGEEFDYKYFSLAETNDYLSELW